MTIVPQDGQILSEYGIKSFAIDQINNKIYFASNLGIHGVGFYSSDLDGSNVKLIDGAIADGEGGDAELVYITGIVIDNESGKVYWAYRGPAGADLEANPLEASGIKMFNLDGSGEVEYFAEGVEAYGLTIDHTKR